MIFAVRCYAVMRHPSVRLSKPINISKTFSVLGNQTILVFPYKMSCQYSDGNPITGASNARGVQCNTQLQPTMVAQFVDGGRRRRSV